MATNKPRITIRVAESSLELEKQKSLTDTEDEEVDSAPEEAKQELLKLLTPYPRIREALRVPRTANNTRLLEALSEAPDKFETLRNGGLSLADAVRVLDMLDLALEAPPEHKESKIAAKSVLTKCVLPCLCLTELVICGLLIWTIETSTGGWNVGKCSLVMFTNITCTEQTTRCAVDLEVRAAQGSLRFYTMQGWHLPVSYKTEMGGLSFASYFGERLKCCNDANGRVGPCCDLMESQSEIFCDNLALLGRKAWDGTPCPSNGWDCLFLIDGFDDAKATDLKFYTPPDLMGFIISAGMVMILLLLAVLWSLIVRFCDCTACLKRKMQWLQELTNREEDDAEVEVVETTVARPSFRPSATVDTVGTIGEDFLTKPKSAPRVTHFRGSMRNRMVEEELVISPELGHVPEALLTLPGVVQQLEMVVEEKRGKERKEALEQECRKYLKWEAYEKPLTELDSEDIHPNFKVGNLNRYAVMAEEARKQKCSLSPLIDPLPPSIHLPPSIPGSQGSTSRPSTAGPQTMEAWARPPSAKRRVPGRPQSASARPGSGRGRPGSAARPGSAMRPQSAVRPQSALRPGSAMRPMIPPSTPAKIEVANL